MEFSLLKTLCGIHAPSGNEEQLTDFLLGYIERHKKEWSHMPAVFHGEEFQNCIVLIFGKPRTAVYAHIDNIGYTVRYRNGLVKIGGPHAKSGTVLHSTDGGIWECKLTKKEDQLLYKSKSELPRGTTLSFKPDFRETKTHVQCCYMDNRLGVWNALKLCETLEHGAVVFSTWEEHGGGSVAYLSKFLYENYRIRQALISDITWVTEGVESGQGVAVSLRDSGIPRKKYVDRIVQLAAGSGIQYQLEVEGSGGSDGTEIQKQPYPIDWCFIGAPEENVHTPDEKVHKSDIDSMLKLYDFLMREL